MTIKIDNHIYLEKDIKKMSLQELNELIFKIEDREVATATELKNSKSKFMENGERSNGEWFRKARTFVAIMNRAKKYVSHIRKLKKGKKTIKDFFIDIARERLTEKIFNEIFEEAKEEYNDYRSNLTIKY